MSFSQLVQLGHSLTADVQRNERACARLQAERDKAVERASSAKAELQAQQTIVGNKEVEIANARETLHKALEEKEMPVAKVMVQSLQESSNNLKKELADSKRHVYQKFLVGTIKESIMKRRLGYMEQLSNEGLVLPDPNEDSDSEKEDFATLPPEPSADPLARFAPPISPATKTAEVDMADSEKTN